VVERRKILTVLVGALALCAGVRADLVPLFPLEASYGPCRSLCAAPDLGPENEPVPFADWAAIAGLAPLPVAFPLESNGEPGETREVQVARIQTDEQNSLSLCLYALLGFGLCRSAPWVKKLSFGVIPDWYHNGGPFQIGHSFAVEPDCLGHPVICFVQPQGAAEALAAQYHRGTIWPLLRRSQFILTVLGGRGPPRMS